MRCVLIGNYGVGNIGDEALKDYFLRSFSDIEWMIVSAKPVGNEQVLRLPFGIRSFFTSWWRTVGAIRRSDAVIFGGGSLFTDSESVLACALWWWHGFVARLCGKPVLMAFQGVGPFQSSVGEWFARRTFERAAFVSVRDEESLVRISSWNLGVTPVLTFDPVFTFFSTIKRTVTDRKMIAIIPRGNFDEQFFVVVSRKLQSVFDEIRILLMQPERERGVGERIAAMAQGKATIVGIRSVDQLCAEIAAASDIVAQRYHGALAALAMGVPVTIVEQARGDKLEGLRLIQSGDPGLRSRLQARVQTGEAALRSALTDENLHRGRSVL